MGRKTSKMTDEQLEDYEVLSIHSSENELGEEPFIEQSGLDNLSDMEDGSDGEGATSFLDGNRSESYSASTTVDNSLCFPRKMNNSSYQTDWDFPWADKPRVMADLQEGLDKDDSNSSDVMQHHPSGALRMTPQEKSDTAVAEKPTDTEIPLRETEWRAVIIPEPQDALNKVEYIIMSGIYKPELRPFIVRLHNKFPNIHLIWVDTKALSLSWITERQVPPPVQQLLAHGLRIDFYSELEDHKPGLHEFINKNIVRGFSRLSPIPVSVFENSEVSRNITICSAEAPIEIDAYGVSHSLTVKSSLDSIEETHLATAAKSTKLVAVRNVLASRHSSQNDAIFNTRRAILALVFFLLSGVTLLLRPSYAPAIPTVFHRSSSSSTGDAPNAWYMPCKAVYEASKPPSQPVSKPIFPNLNLFNRPCAVQHTGKASCKASCEATTGKISCKETGKDTFKATDNKVSDEPIWKNPNALSKHMRDTLTEKLAEVPSVIHVPTLDEIEEIFRNLAIAIHRAAVQARAWGAERADWVKSRSHKTLEKLSIYNDKLSQSVSAGHKRISQAWTEAINDRVASLWKLGRQHGERLLHQ